MIYAINQVCFGWKIESQILSLWGAFFHAHTSIYTVFSDGHFVGIKHSLVVKAMGYSPFNLFWCMAAIKNCWWDGVTLFIHISFDLRGNRLCLALTPYELHTSWRQSHSTWLIFVPNYMKGRRLSCNYRVLCRWWKMKDINVVCMHIVFSIKYIPICYRQGPLLFTWSS